MRYRNRLPGVLVSGDARGRGFTLIELLVVIAIIAILAAILFPVFARARENARKSTCQSNLKQIGMATMQYLQDYDEMFPVYWHDSGHNLNVQTRLEPYMKNTQLWVCPSNSAPYYYYWDNPSGTGAVTGPKGSYGWNITLGYNTTVRSLAQVQQPSETGMWADSIGNGSSSQFTILQENNLYRTSVPHSDGGNMCYVDGHVKWQNKNYLRSGMSTGTRADWDIAL
ncbi:MAG TPA: DUF1559 domain-containing protein [Armatimonadetes bacterium]|nr:DUF1559 domain-containing protein [Armatimonadota bacterium]